MNYDHLNEINSFWLKEIFPNLQHHITVNSFDDYLKKFSFLPSGKWLRDFEHVKVLRMPFVVDPSGFTKNYKKNCVAYCCPTKPDEGFVRIIYQISPTLHLESMFCSWIENKQLQSYMSMVACFKDEKELLHFLKEVEPLHRKGDTEELQARGLLFRNNKTEN